MPDADPSSLPPLRTTPDGVVIPVQAQPGARRNGVVGIHNARWKIAVTVAAQKGQANAAIVEVLAEALQVSRSRVHLLRGDSARQKEFLVEGLTADDVATRLQAQLPARG